MQLNYVTGDIIKLYGERYRIVNSYYTPHHVVHIFVLESKIDKSIIKVRANELYRKACMVKGVPEAMRKHLTIEKKRKIRLAELGIIN